MFDSLGIATTLQSDAVSIKYTISMRKAIYGFSTNAVSATADDTLSTLTATPPLLGIQSSVPVNGTFAVSCTDLNGVEWTTKDLNFDTGPFWVQYHMMEDIPFLMDKI